MHATDAGMIELGKDPRLAQQTRAPLFVQLTILADGFQGDPALQGRIERHKHLAHTAFPQWREDLVVRKAAGSRLDHYAELGNPRTIPHTDGAHVFPLSAQLLQWSPREEGGRVDL